MTNANFRRIRNVLAALAVTTLIAACSPESETASTPSASGASSCSAESLQTLTTGKLTVATGEPAFYPWVIDNAPESGEGFEAAVAYAVAQQLGFAKEDVVWVRTTFDGAVTPGAKTFDFNLQQFSITEERKAAVDFSSPYYSAPQAVVTYKGSAIEGKTAIADLKTAKLGVAVATTSLDYVKDQIGVEPQVFNDNAAAVTALINGQIDGIVLDLPSAFYVSAVQIEDGNGLILGQLPSTGEGDNFGLLLAKDSPLTSCVSQAVDAIKADGSLDAITATWLGTDAGAPVLK